MFINKCKKNFNKIHYLAIIKELFSYDNMKIYFKKTHGNMFNGAKFKAFLLNSGTRQRPLQDNF